MSTPTTSNKVSRDAPRGAQPTVSRRRMMALLGASVMANPAAAAGVTARPAGTVAVGEPLRDGPLRGLNGPPHRLGDFLGKPLLINVWASWCGPCRLEMASLERLAWHSDRPPFNIIGISTDDDETAARRLLESTNATIDHFIDSHLQWETMLGASRLPLTVLVDAHGRVVEKVYGAREWDGPDAAKLLAKAFASHGATASR